MKWIKARKRLEELKAIIEKLEKEVAGARSMAGPATGAVGISPPGSAPGGAVNVGNSETSFGGTENSGRLGIVGTARSPGGNPAIPNFVNVGENISPGMTGGLGLGNLGNAGAGIGSLETAFGPPGEDGRRMGSAIYGPSLSNIGGLGGGVRDLGGNGGGRTGGSEISGNTVSAFGISGGSSTVVSPHGVRSANIVAVGSSSSGTTSSRGVSALNNAGGAGVNVLEIAASGSTATGNTSPGGSNGAGGNTRSTAGSNIVISAVRS